MLRRWDSAHVGFGARLCHLRAQMLHLRALQRCCSVAAFRTGGLTFGAAGCEATALLGWRATLLVHGFLTASDVARVKLAVVVHWLVAEFADAFWNRHYLSLFLPPFTGSPL